MAINADLLEFVSVDELVGRAAPRLRIPDFQRPYSWTPRIAGQLFTDVAEALKERPSSPYVMGTVILLSRSTDEGFEVVDGQQGLLTLHLLTQLLRGERIEHLESGDTPLHLVYQELRQRVADLGGPEGVSRYAAFLGQQARVLRIVTDNEDEAFQFFDSQNFRGKALRPHDLLKAYHLREMADSAPAEQRAVVEQWEQAEENQLDRLFGTYLARIHWWSRNRPAHAFTADDLDLFKGVGRSTRNLPAAEYHRAAKAVLPALQQWAQPAQDKSRARNVNRSLHQIDAPVVAGRPFFEYVTFMLHESEQIEEELYELGAELSLDAAQWEDLREGARYRYCRELFVAAGLYYTNKFSEDDFPRVRRQLFRWAYVLRLAYERLGWRTADNYALGRPTNVNGVNEVNLFAAIRDSLDPRDVPLDVVGAADVTEAKSTADAHLADELKELH